MKKNTFLFLLLPFMLSAQIHVDNNWKNIINPTFQHLDKSKIQSGILLDYAMEFTDVTAYNGILTDTTFVDADVINATAVFSSFIAFTRPIVGMHVKHRCMQGICRRLTHKLAIKISFFPSFFFEV